MNADASLSYALLITSSKLLVFRLIFMSVAGLVTPERGGIKGIVLWNSIDPT